MGFFDDLDAKASPLPQQGPAQDEHQALSDAIDKLALGWVWEGVLTPPPPPDAEEHVEQRVRIEARGGRFLVTHSLAQGRRNRRKTIDTQSERSLDRQGLIELLRDQPQVARKLLEAIGGQVDPDHPDGRSALERG